MFGEVYWIAALLLVAEPATCAPPAGEVTRQMALPYEQFDASDGPGAWRRLNGRACADAAVELLHRYGEANASRLAPAQRSELAFHRGQVLAFADRNAEALPHFERALAIGGNEEWTIYIRGTIAFLRRDLVGLSEARARYGRIAPGSMREKVLAGLASCPTKSYMVAAHCAM